MSTKALKAQAKKAAAKAKSTAASSLLNYFNGDPAVAVPATAAQTAVKPFYTNPIFLGIVGIAGVYFFLRRH